MLSDSRKKRRKRRKIGRLVLVAHDNIGSRQLFEHIHSSFPSCDYLMVIGKGLYYKKSFTASVMHLLRRASWLFVFFRFLELLKYRFRGDTLERRCKKLGIPVIHTHDINSPEMIMKIKEFKPDLLISLFTMQIYRQEVLDVPKYGALTSHPSILPYYRGLEVFFWVLANDEKETGVSVFYLTEKIDAGKVLKQEKFAISKEMSVAALYEKITEIGGRLLAETVHDIDAGTVHARPVKGKGSYYHMPTREAMRRFLRLKKKFF